MAASSAKSAERFLVRIVEFEAGQVSWGHGPLGWDPPAAQQEEAEKEEGWGQYRESFLAHDGSALLECIVSGLRGLRV